MKIYDCEQRSEEWFALRLGKITGTSFQTMANGKPKTIEALCNKAVTEIRTGCPAETPYTNGAMENGIITEAMAREAYEADQLTHVTQVGFLELDEFIGCSPDGLVGEDGGVEIKCPKATTHNRYLDTEPGKAHRDSYYRWQIQGALWITNRKWWDFVSFCEQFPYDLQLLIERVYPDPKCFEKLESGAEYCRAKIKEMLAKKPITKRRLDGANDIQSTINN